MTIDILAQIGLASIGENLVQAVAYGISLGLLYALVALGLTLIFGLMDVVNFAHGASLSFGAYAGLTSYNVIGNFWIAIVLATLASGLLGVVIERGLIQHVYGSNHIFHLVLTFGIALLIEGFLLTWFGPGSHHLPRPPSLGGSAVHIGPVIISVYRLFIIVAVVGILVGILAVLQRSKLGLIIKAGIQDRERTQLLGIRLSRINMLVFGVGTALAALAGVLVAPIFSVNVSLGHDFLIISFIIVIIGGMGNVRGSILAALLVGIVVQITQTFTPEFAGLPLYLAMIAILLLRPEGIFGGT